MTLKTLLLHFSIPALALLGWAGTTMIKELRFKQQCGGYLVRAANANTVELAQQEMARALDHLEQHKITTGYTSVFWRAPNEDLGYWYDNLCAAQGELETAAQSESQLERSNVLLKLRETLMDQGGAGGTALTLPPGISLYPHNTFYFWWGFLSLAWIVAEVVRLCILGS